VTHSRVLTAFALTAAAALSTPTLAQAQQQNQEWFVPGQQRPAAAPARPAAPRPAQAPAPADQLVDESGLQQPPPQIQVQLPPMPELPQIPKGSPTPAAIIGILSVPDVLRVSTAYQVADKELAGRRQKLNEDVQKDRVSLRDAVQALQNDRPKLSPDQVRNRERELQDRDNEARRKFGERNRIIQEAGQYVMLQIDRVLEQIAQQVAASRGVNLVLNRAQILGTTADFDLTPQVADVLNKVLPSVVVPPDGVSPVSMPVPASPSPGTPAAAAPAPAAPAPAAAKPAPAPAPAKK
jgi:Skp family chaperone for outer membrane proteins